MLVLVLWFEGNILTDWKKATNLAQMLFRVSKQGHPREHRSKTLKHSIVKRILVFKR